MGITPKIGISRVNKSYIKFGIDIAKAHARIIVKIVHWDKIEKSTATRTYGRLGADATKKPVATMAYGALGARLAKKSATTRTYGGRAGVFSSPSPLLPGPRSRAIRR